VKRPMTRVSGNQATKPRTLIHHNIDPQKAKPNRKPSQPASRAVVTRRIAHSIGAGAANTTIPQSTGGKASHIKAADTNTATTCMARDGRSQNSGVGGRGSVDALAARCDRTESYGSGMDDLTLARTAARTGAEIVARWSDKIESVDFKGVGNPVTEADRQAEDAIVSLILRHRPGDGVVAEEGTQQAGTTGRRWLIDPLDGTVNFVHGFPHVSVSIAVEDSSGGIAGVVRDVFRGEEFAARRSGGAELDGEAMHVAGRSDLANALVATGFSYDRQDKGPEYGRVLGEMLRHVRGIRRGGSAALDLAWVACGRLDGYWEVRLGPWDVAAGFLLITEAGGVVTALDGGPPSHHDFVAANNALQPALRGTVLAAIGK